MAWQRLLLFKQCIWEFAAGQVQKATNYFDAAPYAKDRVRLVTSTLATIHRG